MSPTGLSDKTAAGLRIPLPHAQSVGVTVITGDPDRYRASCAYPGCPAAHGRVRDTIGEANEDVRLHKNWIAQGARS